MKGERKGEAEVKRQSLEEEAVVRRHRWVVKEESAVAWCRRRVELSAAEASAEASAGSLDKQHRQPDPYIDMTLCVVHPQNCPYHSEPG